MLPGALLSSPGGPERFPDHSSLPSAPSSPLETHQLQGLAGAAAQGRLGDAQGVSEQHQLLGVAQLVGGALGTGRMLSEGDLMGPGCSCFPSPPQFSEVFPSLPVLLGCSAPFCPPLRSWPFRAPSPRHPLPPVPSQPSPAPPLPMFFPFPLGLSSPTRLPDDVFSPFPSPPSALTPSSLPAAQASGVSSLLHPCPAPASPPRLSLTSLSCSTVPSACTFRICSRHLSRKLWGSELVGCRGAAACTSQSALCHSSS